MIVLDMVQFKKKLGVDTVRVGLPLRVKGYGVKCFLCIFHLFSLIVCNFFVCLCNVCNEHPKFVK